MTAITFLGKFQKNFPLFLYKNSAKFCALLLGLFIFAPIGAMFSNIKRPFPILTVPFHEKLKLFHEHLREQESRKKQELFREHRLQRAVENVKMLLKEKALEKEQQLKQDLEIIEQNEAETTHNLIYQFGRNQLRTPLQQPIFDPLEFLPEESFLRERCASGFNAEGCSAFRHVIQAHNEYFSMQRTIDFLQQQKQENGKKHYHSLKRLSRIDFLKKKMATLKGQLKHLQPQLEKFDTYNLQHLKSLPNSTEESIERENDLVEMGMQNSGYNRRQGPLNYTKTA